MAQLIYLDLLSTTRYGSTTPVLHETRTGPPYNLNDPARRQERGNCNTLEDFSLQGLQGRASEGGAAAPRFKGLSKTLDCGSKKMLAVKIFFVAGHEGPN